MGRIAAIDFGLARLGLAISDENQIIALPFVLLKAGKDFSATAHLIAKELARYTHIERIVLGLPLLLSGKDSAMTAQVRAFGIILEQVLGIPVSLWDERLTSAQVEKFLKSANVNRKKRSQVSDVLAAATILQSFLDAGRDY